jgi:hypothetical protein
MLNFFCCVKFLRFTIILLKMRGTIADTPLLLYKRSGNWLSETLGDTGTLATQYPKPGRD